MHLSLELPQWDNNLENKMNTLSVRNLDIKDIPTHFDCCKGIVVGVHGNIIVTRITYDIQCVIVDSVQKSFDPMLEWQTIGTKTKEEKSSFLIIQGRLIPPNLGKESSVKEFRKSLRFSFWVSVSDKGPISAALFG